MAEAVAGNAYMSAVTVSSPELLEMFVRMGPYRATHVCDDPESRALHRAKRRNDAVSYVVENMSSYWLRWMDLIQLKHCGFGNHQSEGQSEQGVLRLGRFN